MIRILIIYFLFTVGFCSCNTEKQKLKTDIKYIGSKDYQPDSLPDLRNDSVYLIFTSYFRDDSINIKNNNSSKILKLNTSEIIGLAEAVTLGKFDNIQNIELTLNRYDPVCIKPDRHNQIFEISFLPDSSKLFVKSVFHLPGFR